MVSQPPTGKQQRINLSTDCAPKEITELVQDVADKMELTIITEQGSNTTFNIYPNKGYMKKQKRSDIVPICILLGFVSLLIFFGIRAGIVSDWKGTFWLSVIIILSGTSCFWGMFLVIIIQKLMKSSTRESHPWKKTPGRPFSSIMVFAFGFIFIAALFVISLIYPNPSAFQYMVFRIVLALAAAGIAAFVPGFLRLKLSNWLTASGAFAIFAIVYFFSPAGLVSRVEANKRILEPDCQQIETKNVNEKSLEHVGDE